MRIIKDPRSKYHDSTLTEIGKIILKFIVSNEPDRITTFLNIQFKHLDEFKLLIIPQKNYHCIKVHYTSKKRHNGELTYKELMNKFDRPNGLNKYKLLESSQFDRTYTRPDTIVGHHIIWHFDMIEIRNNNIKNILE